MYDDTRSISFTSFDRMLLYVLFLLIFISDIDDCESNPCQNGATCQDGIGLYSCSCPTGYDGDQCQMGEDIIMQIFFRVNFEDCYVYGSESVTSEQYI